MQDDLRAGSDALSDTYRGLQGANWLTNGGDLMGGLGGAVAEFQASTLRGTADTLGRTAREFMETARDADPAIVGRERWYSDLDKAGDDVRRFDDLARHADDLEKTAKRLPLKLGGALTVVGIGYDIAREGRSRRRLGSRRLRASVGARCADRHGDRRPVGTAVGASSGPGSVSSPPGRSTRSSRTAPTWARPSTQALDDVKDTGEAIGDAVGGASPPSAGSSTRKTGMLTQLLRTRPAWASRSPC